MWPGKKITRSRSGHKTNENFCFLILLLLLQQCFFPQAIIRVSEQIFPLNICSNSSPRRAVVSMRAHDRLRSIFSAPYITDRILISMKGLDIYSELLHNVPTKKVSDAARHPSGIPNLISFGCWYDGGGRLPTVLFSGACCFFVNGVGVWWEN